MEPERIKRLQGEIDQFLDSFDIDNNDHILTLLFYHYLFRDYPTDLNHYSKETKENLAEQIRKVGEVVDSLSYPVVLSAAESYRYDVQPLFDTYDQWRKSLVSEKELIDAAVRVRVLEEGFYAASRWLGIKENEFENYKFASEALNKLAFHPMLSCACDNFAWYYNEEYRDYGGWL